MHQGVQARFKPSALVVLVDNRDFTAGNCWDIWERMLKYQQPRLYEIRSLLQQKFN
jgi:hypothetical protein